MEEGKAGASFWKIQKKTAGNTIIPCPLPKDHQKHQLYTWQPHRFERVSTRSFHESLVKCEEPYKQNKGDIKLSHYTPISRNPGRP